MNTETAKKHPFFIKKSTLKRFLIFFFAAAYAAFIVYALQLQYSLGTGDVGSYLYFFDQFGGTAPELSLRQDGAFRLGIFLLRDVLNLEVLTILACLAFIMSLVIFFLFSVHIRSEKYLIYLFPIITMVFLTPSVQALFSSNIRSGIAFTILMVAFVHCKGLIKYGLLAVASVIHLSMLPLISLHYFYHILNSNFMKTPYLGFLFLLLIGSFVIAFAGSAVHVEAEVSSSFAFNLMIFYITFLTLFINKLAIKNIYAFMSIGLLFIYLSGVIIDVSYSRYIGNAILFYLFFLIKKGELGTIQIFTLGYAPFFILTLFYSVSNQL